MVSEEIHHFEESKRLATAMVQPKQGAWTRWENTKDRTITWSDIKQMEPKQLGFLIKAVYDILPTPVSLRHWGLSTSNFYKACGKIANLKHVWGCPRGEMVKAMDCGIVVSEFILQSRYYVHFRANTLGKGMNHLILPVMS